MVDHPLLIQPPIIVPRTESNFVNALFEDLKTSEGRKAVRAAADDVKARGLRLLQPIHRTSNVLLVDVACEGYGLPRLDPDKIHSAGLVVRRVATGDRERILEPEVLEGWFQHGKKVRGWTEFSNAEDLDHDPDPKFRKAPFSSGHAQLNRRLIRLAEKHFEIAEQVTPAFAVPQEVCEASGRTLVFGVIPVASLEVSDADEPVRYSDEELSDSLPPLFREGPAKHLSESALHIFLKQIAFELGAFGDAPEERALMTALNNVRMDDGTGAGDSLRNVFAATVQKGIPPVEGLAWPPVSRSAAGSLKSALFAAKQARLSRAFPPSPRFEGSNTYYRARLFLRVKNHPECPPTLYWSQYSERFRIAPWFEPAGPPIKIPLPDIDRNSVKNLTPNVAFQLPPSLFDLLAKNAPKDFLDGKGQAGGASLGVAWICSFSLPIITLCAFIVLNIFLQLFHIIFQWLFYIKICIPIPVMKRKDA